jgi:hypothetical protein
MESRSIYKRKLSALTQTQKTNLGIREEVKTELPRVFFPVTDVLDSITNNKLVREMGIDTMQIHDHMSRMLALKNRTCDAPPARRWEDFKCAHCKHGSITLTRGMDVPACDRCGVVAGSNIFEGNPYRDLEGMPCRDHFEECKDRWRLPTRAPSFTKEFKGITQLDDSRITRREEVFEEIHRVYTLTYFRAASDSDILSAKKLYMDLSDEHGIRNSLAAAVSAFLIVTHRGPSVGKPLETVPQAPILSTCEKCGTPFYRLLDKRYHTRRCGA